MMTKYELDLFVVGGSDKAERAEQNVRRLCDDLLGGLYELRVIDVLENGEAAEEANIVATPTLVRRAPLPVRVIVGDLSDPIALAHGLGLDLGTNEREGNLSDE